MKRLSSTDQNSSPLINVPTPTADNDAANKQYFDNILDTESLGQPQTIRTYGDSITAGLGASGASTRWANLLAAMKGFTLTNSGVSGARSNDPTVMDAIYGTNITSNTNSTLMIGVNNARANGTNIGYAEVFRGCVLAEAVWLALPDAYKIRVNNMSQTGTWSLNSLVSLYNGNGYSAAAAATLTTTVTGNVVYVATDATGGGTGVFSVTIDGVDYGQYDMNTHRFVNARSDSSGSYSAYMLRFAGLDSGAHVVVLTWVAGTVYIDWVAGNGYQRLTGGPNVWLANNTRASAAYYSANSPHSEAAVRLHNTMLADIAALLALDGLNVAYVDAMSSINNSSDLSDGLHPNDTGHAKIAGAFFAAMSSYVKPSDRGGTQRQATGWIPLTLANTWVTFSAAYPTPSVMRDANGFVHLRGVIKNGTVNTTTAMFILPEGFRPGQRRFIGTISNGAAGAIEISNNGACVAYVGNTAYVSLDTVTFLGER